MPKIVYLQVSEKKIIEAMLPDSPNNDLPEVIICRPMTFVLDNGSYRLASCHEFPDFDIAQQAAFFYKEAQK